MSTVRKLIAPCDPTYKLKLKIDLSHNVNVNWPFFAIYIRAVLNIIIASNVGFEKNSTKTDRTTRMATFASASKLLSIYWRRVKMYFLLIFFSQLPKTDRFTRFMAFVCPSIILTASSRSRFLYSRLSS